MRHSGRFTVILTPPLRRAGPLWRGKNPALAYRFSQEKNASLDSSLRSPLSGAPLRMTRVPKGILLPPERRTQDDREYRRTTTKGTSYSGIGVAVGEGIGVGVGVGIGVGTGVRVGVGVGAQSQGTLTPMRITVSP